MKKHGATEAIIDRRIFHINSYHLTNNHGDNRTAWDRTQTEARFYWSYFSLLIWKKSDWILGNLKEGKIKLKLLKLSGVVCNEYDIIIVNSEDMLSILVLHNSQSEKEKRKDNLHCCCCFKRCILVEHFLYTSLSNQFNNLTSNSITFCINFHRIPLVW